MTNPNDPSKKPGMNAKLNAEIRRQNALQRLGCDDPRCLRCGENEPLCLELHHLAGQAYDDATVILCRNCHRKASDMQRDHPPKLSEPPTLHEEVGHFLLGLAVLFILLIDKCQALGNALIEYARSQAPKEPDHG